MTVNDEIDRGVEIISSIISLGAGANPMVAAAAPLLNAYVKFEASRWKAMLEAGTIIPDGQGGFIPAHGQSIYDPKTGFFTGQKT